MQPSQPTPQGPEASAPGNKHLEMLITLVLGLTILGCAIGLTIGIGKPHSWLINDKGQITYTDHAALWGAGRLALEGKAAAAYDWAAHAAMMAQAMGREVQQLPFPYPPIFLTVIAPFAAMPYVTSLLAWSGLTLAIYLLVLGGIVGRWQGAVWLGAMIVTLGNFIVGQNGFLTAALIGGGLLLLQKRPVVAGILLGALAYKPHLGLLLPVALAAAGCWRAFASAAATVVVLVLVSIGMYGLEPWLAFAEGLGRFGAQVTSAQYAITWKLQSVYGLLATLGLPKGFAMAAQVLTAIALMALTAVMWRSEAPHAIKAACLVSAVALMSPYVFLYDLTLLAVALAFLLRHWLAEGNIGRDFLVVVIGVNLLVLLMMTVKLPTGFLASVLLLAASLQVAWPYLEPELRRFGAYALGREGGAANS